MNARLRRQIEEIADTTEGATCRVIVQMEPPHDVAKFIAATSKAVAEQRQAVGSSRVDLQACKLEYSIVSPK